MVGMHAMLLPLQITSTPNAACMLLCLHKLSTCPGATTAGSLPSCLGRRPGCLVTRPPLMRARRRRRTGAIDDGTPSMAQTTGGTDRCAAWQVMPTAEVWWHWRYFDMQAVPAVAQRHAGVQGCKPPAAPRAAGCVALPSRPLCMHLHELCTRCACATASHIVVKWLQLTVSDATMQSKPAAANNLLCPFPQVPLHYSRHGHVPALAADTEPHTLTSATWCAGLTNARALLPTRLPPACTASSTVAAVPSCTCSGLAAPLAPGLLVQTTCCSSRTQMMTMMAGQMMRMGISIR
jgi:hypothetical protein